MMRITKICFCLLALLLWTQVLPVAAIQRNAVLEINEVYVNYQLVESEEKAFINQQFQVMVPLTDLLEATQQPYSYEADTGNVVLEGNPRVILHPKTGAITVDGKAYQGKGTATILNQRTYLPLHLLVEFYGYQVYCEEVTRSIYINTDYTMTPEDYQGFRRVENLPKPTFISHAGGMTAGMTHTNSREAIEDSLKRGNYFVELDFLFTTDDQVVLGHNWGLMSHLMELETFPVSHQVFMESVVPEGLTQMDLDMLVDLMEEEKKLYVITDAKERNQEVLSHIATEYPHMKQRFIPQVYDEEEYEAVSQFGYSHLIYSLYQVYRTDGQVLEFAARYQPYAVTMATERVKSGLAEQLKAVGVFTYTHTINSEEELHLYREMGVDGVYTAALSLLTSSEALKTEGN